LVSLEGVILGPEDVPISGASVELVDLETTTRTDSRGAFVFEAVPSEPPPRRLLVRVKGKETDIDLDALPFGDEPLVIRIDLSD
jgi:hypothetical protein